MRAAEKFNQRAHNPFSTAKNQISNLQLAWCRKVSYYQTQRERKCLNCWKYIPHSTLALEFRGRPMTDRPHSFEPSLLLPRPSHTLATNSPRPCALVLNICNQNKANSASLLSLSLSFCFSSSLLYFPFFTLCTHIRTNVLGPQHMPRCTGAKFQFHLARCCSRRFNMLGPSSQSSKDQQQ